MKSQEQEAKQWLLEQYAEEQDFNFEMVLDLLLRYRDKVLGLNDLATETGNRETE